jgi:hypothetical protein
MRKKPFTRRQKRRTTPEIAASADASGIMVSGPMYIPDASSMMRGPAADRPTTRDVFYVSAG